MFIQAFGCVFLDSWCILCQQCRWWHWVWTSCNCPRQSQLDTLQSFEVPTAVMHWHRWFCSTSCLRLMLQSELNSPAVLAQPSRCVTSKVKRKSNLLLFSFAQALHGVVICLSSLSSSPLKTEFCWLFRLYLCVSEAFEAFYAKCCYYQTIALLPELDTIFDSCWSLTHTQSQHRLTVVLHFVPPKVWYENRIHDCTAENSCPTACEALGIAVKAFCLTRYHRIPGRGLR